MGYQEKLDEIYNEAVRPLESYTPSRKTLTHMITYMNLFGEVMDDFGKKVNEQQPEFEKLYPGNRDKIIEYILELKNKIVKTYKPK